MSFRLYPSWIKNQAEFLSLSVLERALQIAAARVGERETRRNSGPLIDRFLAFVGLGPGYAWCSAFVYWCLINAGFPAKSLPKARSAAAVIEWQRWAEREGLLTDTPDRGDLMFWINANGRTGHIGLITKVNGSALSTIEGNTDDAGSREGDGVYRKTRILGGKTKAISLNRLVERLAAKDAKP